MERKRLVTIALLLGCALVDAALASTPSTEEAILLLQDALDRIFGRRDAYALYLYPPSPNDPPGYFPLLELSADDARIDGVPLAHVSLTLRSVVLDVASLERGCIRLCRGSVKSLDVLISERDVNRVLRQQSISRRVSNLKVRLSGDTVHVKGRLSIGFLSPDASLTGGLEVVDQGRKILFIPDEMKVGGLSAGRGSLEDLQNKINPVVDLDTIARRYNIDLRIKWIRATRGELRIAG